jgi:multidrug resistance efflux pump
MNRRGVSTVGVVATLVLVVGAGIWLLFIGGSDGGGGRVFAGELYEVARGEFEITVPSSGELAAEHQISIHNHLESSAMIIELVDEGTRVEVGDVLLRLNDEKIRDSIRNSELNVTDATNNLQNSRSSFSIAEKRRDSELAVKQLDIDLAKLALQAWQEGEVVAKRQDLELAVQTADKNYQRLLKKYESSVELYEQKFLSKDELDQDEIAVLNAEATLKKANLDVVVYENYTHEQEKQKNESDLKQSQDEYERAVVRCRSELQSSQANITAKENQLASHQERLEKLRNQLEACVVLAPGSGMVVYASSMGMWDDDKGTISVGKSLHRNELLMTIPDTSNMIARVKVNEALSGLITKGQRAMVTCDALPDGVFEGNVMSVGVLAEGGGWRDPNRRDYTVLIKLLDTGGAPLKPSMRCAAEIYVDRITDVLFVPIHAVHRDGSVVWVWVQRGGGFAQQPIQLGQFSESYAAIESGLNAGDVVLLREPSPGQVVGRLPKEDVKE